MGAQNKLLLPYKGVPMIRHMAAIYKEATNAPVYVVTGHEAEWVEDALRGTGAITIHNARFEEGQQSSVTFGLRALPKDADVLVGLGDQPLLNVADVRALVAAHTNHGASRISVPTRGEMRGNPIIIPASLRSRVLADPRGSGCKSFTRTHLEQVQMVPMEASGFFADVDTPQAYADLRAAEQEIAS